MLTTGVEHRSQASAVSSCNTGTMGMISKTMRRNEMSFFAFFKSQAPPFMKMFCLFYSGVVVLRRPGYGRFSASLLTCSVVKRPLFLWSRGTLFSGVYYIGPRREHSKPAFFGLFKRQNTSNRHNPVLLRSYVITSAYKGNQISIYFTDRIQPRVDKIHPIRTVRKTTFFLRGFFKYFCIIMTYFCFSVKQKRCCTCVKSPPFFARVH